VVSLIRNFRVLTYLRISETMLKFSLCLLRLTSLSVVKPSPTCGFADPEFSQNQTNADQRNTVDVSLIRDSDKIRKTRISETTKSVVSLIRKFADSLPYRIF
jgi:hypothetical protein